MQLHMQIGQILPVFSSRRFFNQRTIVYVAGLFSVFFSCCELICFSSMLKLSAFICTRELMVLFSLPFLIIVKFTILMTRRFKTPIKMACVCYVFVIELKIRLFNLKMRFRFIWLLIFFKLIYRIVCNFR